MKTPPKRDKPRELTAEEVEAALHAALRDEGQLFPESDEDVAALEDSLDLSGVPTPDRNEFSQLLHEHVSGKVIPLPDTAQAVSSAVEENLAMAARNGGKIPKEVRNKMDADRTAAEAGQ